VKESEKVCGMCNEVSLIRGGSAFFPWHSAVNVVENMCGIGRLEGGSVQSGRRGKEVRQSVVLLK